MASRAAAQLKINPARVMPFRADDSPLNPGGGGHWFWNESSPTLALNNVRDEEAVHEAAHAYFTRYLANTWNGGDAFVTALERLAVEPDSVFAWPSALARAYLVNVRLQRNRDEYGRYDHWGNGAEEHGGLWSGVMGNIYQLPAYMWPFYQGMFDMAIPESAIEEQRFGTGYEEFPDSLPGPKGPLPTGVYWDPDRITYVFPQIAQVPVGGSSSPPPARPDPDRVNEFSVYWNAPLDPNTGSRRVPGWVFDFIGASVSSLQLPDGAWVRDIDRSQGRAEYWDNAQGQWIRFAYLGLS